MRQGSFGKYGDEGRDAPAWRGIVSAAITRQRLTESEAHRAASQNSSLCHPAPVAPVPVELAGSLEPSGAAAAPARIVPPSTGHRLVPKFAGTAAPRPRASRPPRPPSSHHPRGLPPPTRIIERTPKRRVAVLPRPNFPNQAQFEVRLPALASALDSSQTPKPTANPNPRVRSEVINGALIFMHDVVVCR